VSIVLASIQKNVFFCANYGVSQGHIACNEGLLVDPCKIATIITMLAPTNVTKIKRFLGTIGFVDNSSKKCQSPMCKLQVKKNEEFIWNDACNKSWEWMKASMTCLPVLIIPN
jgi:hypothetical protein